MNFKQTSTLAGILAGSALALSATPAQAASFGFSAQDAVDGACVGQASCIVNDFFNLSTNKQITAKNVGEAGYDVLGLGVASDASNMGLDTSEGEIDADEWFDIGFKEAAVLEQLQLSHMYQPGEMYDWVYEKAEVEIKLADGSTQTGTLEVTGDTTATWSGSGSVSNVSASFDGTVDDFRTEGVVDHNSDDRDLKAEAYRGGGSYTIANPFGNLEIAGLRLKPIVMDAPEDSPIALKSGDKPAGWRNSDFTVSSVVATVSEDAADIPEPATTAALIGFGAMALGLRRRKQ